jgi:hypothetical protein
VRIDLIRDCRGGLLALLLSSTLCAFAVEPGAGPPPAPENAGPATPPPPETAAPAAGSPPAPETAAPAAGPPPAMTDDQRRLAEYTAARQAFEEAATAYWTSVADKRRMRNAKRRNNEVVVAEDYVLTQPPVYSGPPRPADPVVHPASRPPSRKKYVPVAADFLKYAAEHFNFVPRRPNSESEFKRAYAAVAAEAGLTRDQVVRIYAFESGGNGRYDVQAGLESSRPRARAIYTAFGYNQLVGATSIELLAEKGDHFLETLRAKADREIGPARAAFDTRLDALERMIAFARTVPDQWREHEKLADTPRGIAIHAVLLDVDIGPLLQSRKLIDSLEYARRQGIERPLSAVELQMMNLTGDGNGLDIVLMPGELRTQVPTANFFVRAGYERNAVAIRNNVVAKLMAVIEAKMDSDCRLHGAQEMAAAYEDVRRVGRP